MGFLPSIWAIAGIILIGIEFLFPGLVAIFLGVGALVTALIISMIPGLREDLATQILIWIGSSGFPLFVLRRSLKKIFSGIRYRGSVAELSGRSAEVTEPIKLGRPGRVRIDGTSWKAVSSGDSFVAGDVVEIVRKDNITLEVTKSYVGEEDLLTDISRRRVDSE